MSATPDQVYRGYLINLAPLADRGNVVWKVTLMKRRKYTEIVRDIAPDAEQAWERATAFIDSLLEQP